MHIETIEELADVLHRSPLTRLEVEGEDWALALEKPPAEEKPAPPRKSPPGAAPLPEPADSGLVPVESPMVGVFHEAMTPVVMGQAVRVADSLGSIEALGLRNEVRAIVDGEVAEVNVEEGQPVEYGQTLFTLFTLAPAEDDA